MIFTTYLGYTCGQYCTNVRMYIHTHTYAYILYTHKSDRGIHLQ